MQTVQWSLLFIAFGVILARLYLRLILQRRRLLASDLFMCAGWCTAATTAALDIVFWKMGTMRKGVTLGLVGWNGTAEDASYFYKVRRCLFPFVQCANICWKLYHFADYPFHTTFYLSKAALLSVYLQVFPSFMVKRRRFLWAVIAYVAASYTTTILILTCICLPTWRHWSVLHSTCRTSGLH